MGVAGAETVVVGASLSLSDTYFDPFGNVLLFKLVAGGVVARFELEVASGLTYVRLYFERLYGPEL